MLLVALALAAPVELSALAAPVELVEDAPKKVTTRHVLKSLDYRFSFEQYAAEYRKVYTDAEKPSRQAAFEASLSAIKAHNENFPAPSWFMGLSEHSDKSKDEWASLKGLHRGAFFSAAVDAAVRANTTRRFDPPASLDWRDSGVVTPVKNQGGCGSCWAFSAAETVESAYGMATLKASGKAISIPILSPQQLVDCAPNPEHCGGTGGCAGSTQPLAFQYLISSGGEDSDLDYPYTARDGKCVAGSLEPVIGISGYEDLPMNDYTALLEALVNEGPIAISVDASWGAYEDGVFSSDSNWLIDHAVQLVGYGTEGGKDYWLVRNSWGTSWGENGYIKLEKFGEGKEPCGTDTAPESGFVCEGGPSTITVCGTSGMLSGSSYPTGAKLL